MPFYLIHAGTALQKVSTAGALTTLTLPGGVTVSASRRARFAILGRRIVVTNAPSVNLVIEASDLSVSVMNIATGPAATMTAAVGAAGLLSGTYRYVVTFAIMSGATVLSESVFSTVTGPIDVTLQQVDLAVIPVSGTAGVNARRIYRTTDSGTDYYLVTTIADNVTTTYSDNTSDYDLGLLPVINDLGSPPGVDGTDRLKVIVAWKDRLWGAGTVEPDKLRYSGQNKVYAWNAVNFLNIKPVGQDVDGITAFAPRRDELGVFKRYSLWKVLGIDESDFRVIQVAENVGCIAPDSVVIIRDTAYFLAADGVYTWDGSGVTPISRDKVHPWFTTDTYFDRADFPNAFAKWNPLYDTYELHLPNAGSSNVDRWVSYDTRRKIWLGPHKTDAFTPTFGGLMEDADSLLIPIQGSSAGFLYKQNRSTFTDDSTAIAFDVTTKFHHGNAPDIEHYWGELAIISKVESAGTLTITPTVGGLNAVAGAAISHDLTLGRQRLRRLGTGRFAQLRFQQSSNNQGVEIYGYEIPFHELGRR
jgi:hypothetical protein